MTMDTSVLEMSISLQLPSEISEVQSRILTVVSFRVHFGAAVFQTWTSQIDRWWSQTPVWVTSSHFGSFNLSIAFNQLPIECPDLQLGFCHICHIFTHVCFFNQFPQLHIKLLNIDPRKPSETIKHTQKPRKKTWTTVNPSCENHETTCNHQTSLLTTRNHEPQPPSGAQLPLWVLQGDDKRSGSVLGKSMAETWHTNQCSYFFKDILYKYTYTHIIIIIIYIYMYASLCVLHIYIYTDIYM